MTISYTTNPNPVPANTSYNLTWTDTTKTFSTSFSYRLLVNSVIMNSVNGNNTHTIVFNANPGLSQGSYAVQVSGGIDGYQGFGPNLVVTCFAQGTLISCVVDGIDKQLAIEDIQLGTSIQTLHGPKSLLFRPHIQILNNPDDDLKCLFKHKSLDLVLTGGHSLLVPILTEEQQFKTIQLWGHLKQQDGFFLLLTMFNTDFYKITDVKLFNLYHIVLEDNDEHKSHSIYANGLLSESLTIHCCKARMLDNQRINQSGLIVI